MNDSHSELYKQSNKQKRNGKRDQTEVEQLEHYQPMKTILRERQRLYNSRISVAISLFKIGSLCVNSSGI